MPADTLVDRRFAIVAGVAAKHALTAGTKVRVDLCYGDDRVPSHARVVFGDQERWLEIDIAAGASADLGTYGQLVAHEIERARPKAAP